VTAHPAASARPGRLPVGVVGAGRVGSVLGAALARAGHVLAGASAVSAASVDRAERLLPSAPLLPPDEVARRSALLLLAVPDDALPGLVEGLAATGALRPGQLVVHTSGAHGLGVLAPAADVGALPLALHPAMPFPGGSSDLARLAGASFGVTAPEPLRPAAEALVLEMGGEPVWVADEARPLYHAALVAGANHLVTLVAESADLLRAAGIGDPSRLLGPLLGAALDNALRSGDAGQTGPVVRGDAGTVAAHLDVLERVAPESIPAYLAMARLTADRALASRRLRPAEARRLLDVLARTAGTS
jgi:predicted short-subunit dehydrogenase-like oxidoreductase (DUF2520 family)